MNNLAESWDWFCHEAHQLAYEKGWWDGRRSFLEAMALVASELGEAIEAFRTPRASTKILAFSHAEEELADIIIRIADLCTFYRLDLGASPELSAKAEMFDACCIGNPEDRFVCCFDTLLANPSDILKSAHNITLNNPVERIAAIVSYLGEAILAFTIDNDELSTESALASVIIEACLIATEQKFDLGEAILAKHAYNKSRAYRHGAKVY